MDVSSIENAVLDHRIKGLPGGIAPFPLSAIGTKGWNVLRGDLPLPIAVLRQSALDQNSRWMRTFLASSGVDIAPHGKTTCSPQLYHRQLDDGAWAITVATVHQLQVAREYGVSRVLLGNQLLGRQEIRYVLDEIHNDPLFDFYCLVDSIQGAQLLRDAVEAHPLERPLQLLLEVGYQGGRTGCRSLEESIYLARVVHSFRPHLALRGVEGFEGFITGDTPADAATRVDAFLELMVQAATQCAAQQLFEPGTVILSAGGSAFFDRVAQRFAQTELRGSVQVLLRSGCYVTHDARMYRDAFEQILERTPQLANMGGGLEPALELWAYLQSRPEPGLAIVTLGKRDAGSDAGWPLPKAWLRPEVHSAPQRLLDGDYTITNMNDQHAFLDLPPTSPLRVGDMVAFGISHPCTTFDKWQLLLLVDDAYNVLSAIRTFF